MANDHEFRKFVPAAIKLANVIVETAEGERRGHEQRPDPYVLSESDVEGLLESTEGQENASFQAGPEHRTV
jgi:hypothetical protein